MAKSKITDLEARVIQIATDHQQNFYEIVSDWNRYKNDELDYLKDFIGIALCGRPIYKVSEHEEQSNGNIDNGDKHFLYDKDQAKIIHAVYEKVKEYGLDSKSEGVVLCGIIYNVIYNRDALLSSAKKDETKHRGNTNKSTNGKGNADKSTNDNETKNDEQCALLERVFPVPVLRVYQPKTKKIVYIDEGARVYNGFLDYLKHNTLPKCMMVVPKDGRYRADPASCSEKATRGQNNDDVKTKVWLEILKSPASKLAAKILIGVDTTSTIASVFAMGVGITSMFTPLGPVVLAAGAVGAGVSGLWSAGRCAEHLADRGLHGESVNVTDKQALGSWIGIAGSTMGLAATGGTALLARAVRTGTTVSKTAMIIHDGVQIGNLIVNGVGASVKSYDMMNVYIKDGMKPTAKDVFHLTTHIFFFCNSVFNVRLAKSFIDNSQKQLLNDYEKSLRSERHRKEFQRIARNTRASGNNDISSNEEIIRGINKIENRDDFFQSMVRNRKAFSASGAKASFVDGKVTINSVLSIDPIEFAKLTKDVRVDIVRAVSNAPPPNSATTGSKIGHVNNEVSYKNFNTSNKNALKDFFAHHSSAMLQSAPANIRDFSTVLEELHNLQNSVVIFMKLLEIAFKIYQELEVRETTVGEVLSEIVQFIWDYVKMNILSGNPGIKLEDPEAQRILNMILGQLLLHVGRKIDVWVEAFRQWLKDRYKQKIGGHTDKGPQQSSPSGIASETRKK